MGPRSFIPANDVSFLNRVPSHSLKMEMLRCLAVEAQGRNLKDYPDAV